MTEDDTLIEMFYKVRKGEFGYIERIELTQNLNPANWKGFCLEVDLRSGTDPSSPSMQLVFKGVQEFCINEFVGIVRYMIEITCIRDRQMEGKTFRVTESEYNAISFVCDSFEFIHS
jgi:hypothetical protein